MPRPGRVGPHPLPLGSLDLATHHGTGQPVEIDQCFTDGVDGLGARGRYQPDDLGVQFRLGQWDHIHRIHCPVYHRHSLAALLQAGPASHSQQRLGSPAAGRFQPQINPKY